MVTLSLVCLAAYEETGFTRNPSFRTFLSAAGSAAILSERITDLATRLIYLLYRFLEVVALPFIVLYVLYRCARNRRYFRHCSERLGILPSGIGSLGAGAVWLHAVSVGEILAAVELLRRLKDALPGVPLYVSTTTLAGRAMADEKLRGLAAGVFFLPFDYVAPIRRVIRRIRPGVLVVVETEIWPNLFREAKRAGAGVLVVNGRISDRAAPRYRRLAWFFRHVLSHADRILVQSPQDQRRFLAAGAPLDRTSVAGNLKYDFEARAASVPAEITHLLERVRPQHVWIAASTMPPADPGDPDEDEVVIEAFRRLAPSHPGLLLILAPRKPERFGVAAAKLAGIPYLRRSRLAETDMLPLPGVLLLDSIGELSGLFGLADVVFMGGTMPHRGGHNILEPAFHARAVIAGPHMENFAAIAEEFTAAGALIRIRQSAELHAAVERLLADQEQRRHIGERALHLAQQKRGAAARATSEIATLHGQSVPRTVHNSAEKLFLIPLSWIWTAVGAALRKSRYARRETLRTPVVSVGGIAMGGTGKTPFVLWLAEKLRERGCSAGFLTRGYRRRCPEPVTLIPPGGPASTRLTGDEAQLLVRSGLGPVAIGADRCLSGRYLESQYTPTVILLDDGFQHVRLARDLDIVLVDSLDPFRGGVFPCGRLREPPTALAQADVIVLTRTRSGRSYAGLEQALRLYNPAAPVFHARVVPLYWTDGRQRWEPAALPFCRVAAFCGLANPSSFWNSLDELGLPVIMRFPFGDHHNYSPRELLRLARRCEPLNIEALLTTEKDAVNLPENAAELLAPAKVCWLRIGIALDRESELLDLVASRVVKPCAS